jgi:hypothetical protein
MYRGFLRHCCCAGRAKHNWQAQAALQMHFSTKTGREATLDQKFAMPTAHVMLTLP